MSLKAKVEKAFIKQANEETKKKYEGYFKGVVKLYGLKGPETKAIFKEFRTQIKILPLDEKINLALELIKSEYQESKGFSVLILEKEWKKLDEKFINTLEKTIEKHVYDWATCDILSSKTLGNMIRKNGKYAQIIKKWKDSDYMRVQRASCIAFLKVAKFGEHNDTIMDICSTTIQNPERFVQLGTGWVLRELSLADLDLVKNFIIQNYHHFSREGLRYAIEKMNKEDREILLKHGK